MCNPGDHKNPSKDFTFQQRMFRKFFYENSSFIESETMFVEITDKRLAKSALGINDQNTLLAV